MDQEQSTEQNEGGSSETTADGRELLRRRSEIEYKDQAVAFLDKHYSVNDGGSASDNESDVLSGEGRFLPLPLLPPLPPHISSRQSSFDLDSCDAYTRQPQTPLALATLLKGERVVAEEITPELFPVLRYSSVTTTWYYLNESNLWVASKKPNVYMVVRAMQRKIQAELDIVGEKIGEETNDDAEARLWKERTELARHYNAVGKTSYTKQVVNHLETLLLDEVFASKLDDTEGTLVFRNGILDLRTEEFRDGFLSDDMISTTLAHEYQKESFDVDKMRELRGYLKQILNNNEEHLEYYLCCLGHAFTGSSSKVKGLYFIIDATEGGTGDNGKSFFFDILSTVFPELVGKTQYSLIEDGNKTVHKQLKKLDRKRLVFIDEGNQKAFRADLLKEIANGGSLENQILFGTTELLRITWKLFICSNHLPTIRKKECTVYNRYHQIQFGSHLLRKPK